MDKQKIHKIALSAAIVTLAGAEEGTALSGIESLCNEQGVQVDNDNPAGSMAAAYEKLLLNGSTRPLEDAADTLLNDWNQLACTDADLRVPEATEIIRQYAFELTEAGKIPAVQMLQLHDAIEAMTALREHEVVKTSEDFEVEQEGVER